jgi:hypothetical protein
LKEFVFYRPDILKRAALFALVGFIVAIGLNIRWNYVYLSYNFNGRIDSIRYGDKGTAIIIVKKKEYVLGDEWSSDQILIHKGDSIMKLKNATQIKLIRPNGVTIVK